MLRAAIVAGLCLCAAQAAPAGLTPADVLRALDTNGVPYQIEVLEQLAAEAMVAALGEKAHLRSASNGLAIAAGGGTSAVPVWAASARDLGIACLPVADLSAEALAGIAAGIENGSTSALRGVVLDLRGLGVQDDTGLGRLAGLFLEGGTPLYRVVHSTGQVSRVVSATQPTTWRGPLAVLINEETRGIAEALAAVLHTRASTVLLGQPTAGERARYEYITLSDDWMAHLPVARLEFSGSTPETPVTPDIPVGPRYQIFDPGVEDSTDERPLTADAREVRALLSATVEDAPMNRALNILLGVDALGVGHGTTKRPAR